jgi:hypothetical protein
MSSSVHGYHESSGPSKRLKPQDYVLKIPPTPKSSSNSQVRIWSLLERVKFIMIHKMHYIALRCILNRYNLLISNI